MDTTAADLNVWRSLFSLVLVLGMMWGFLWFFRRYRGGSRGPGRRMKLIEQLPIDARRTLMLVQIDGQDVMLGVTPEQIALLKTLNRQAGDEI